MSRKIQIAVAVLILAFLAFGAARWWAWSPAREMETTAREMIGRPEAALISKLGEPKHTVSSATLAGRTVDYPWSGMNFVPVPDHPVRNKVLLYSKLNFAIYVYIDEHGVVEHVAVAGT